MGYRVALTGVAAVALFLFGIFVTIRVQKDAQPYNPQQSLLLGSDSKIIGQTAGLHVEQLPEDDVQSGHSVVLVTGAAGFIGYSLAKRIIEGGTAVVGIDNFNEYYDIDLKADRALALAQLGVKMQSLSVCDGDRLNDLIKHNNVTHVLHMAGQAGVRYSLKKPHLYAKDNIECFSVLLGVLARHQRIKLVFASSSSVLGSADGEPIASISPGSRPQSVYAATKRSNEILARIFHGKHGIPTIGLRFFTVYGPWGRPDMAVFDFISKIDFGTEVDVYDYIDLSRDFTYIDDIVDGVVAAMNKKFSFGIYNLGSSKPEKVSTLINYIENELGKKAIIRFVPISRAEVKKSWADTSAARQDFGFNAKVDLLSGIKRTVKWWLEYKALRVVERNRVKDLKEQAKRGQKLEPAELLSAAMQLVVELKQSSTDGEIANLHNHWNRWSENFNRRDMCLIQKLEPNANTSVHNSFKFWKGFKSPGFDLRIHHGASVESLKASCILDPHCAGFSSDGVLKRKIVDRKYWIPW